jgi:hypothetical protein
LVVVEKEAEEEVDCCFEEARKSLAAWREDEEGARGGFLKREVDVSIWKMSAMVRGEREV